MDKKVQEFLDYAREDGISLQELLTGIVNIDDSYAFMTIKKEIELGKQNGADADFVYDKLLSIVSGEQMYTYIRIQEIVNEITSDEGLEICLDFDLDELEILKANRDAIKQELKNRGVEYVGYVENNVSGVVTVQAATSAMEMSAWEDIWGEKESQFYEYFYDSILSNLEDAIFKCTTEGMVIDIEQTADEALTYKDIYRVLNSEDTAGFSKHDFDIYFAYKAVTGDVIYYDDDIEFLIIVDEEHSNNTAKANDLLRYFDAIHTVRVSATTVTSTDVEYKEVDEEAVIGEGLITEASPYEGYSSAFVTSNCRKSDPEIDFEKHCERSSDVEWFYKNGDKGIDYLSVVYQGTLGNSQSLFYPDYVVKLNDGTVWIIETKGGQKGKQDQNIDIKVLSKFYAFKDYAEKNKINWGFVRPMNGELYLNNTEYTKNIEDSRWVNLNNFF